MGGVVGVVAAAVVVVYIYPLFSGPAAPYLFVRTCVYVYLPWYHGTMVLYHMVPWYHGTYRGTMVLSSTMYVHATILVASTIIYHFMVVLYDSSFAIIAIVI